MQALRDYLNTVVRITGLTGEKFQGLKTAPQIFSPLQPVQQQLFNQKYAKWVRMRPLLHYVLAGILTKNGDCMPLTRQINTISCVTEYFVEFKRGSDRKDLPGCPS